MVLRCLFFINGLYDILCAACILHIIEIPVLSKLHLSMIKTETNPITERYLAYWIFTYGVVRMSGDYQLIACSYFMEALFFWNEYRNDAVYTDKAWFVILSSIGLGVLALEN
jgi:hypothetical protein